MSCSNHSWKRKLRHFDKNIIQMKHLMVCDGGRQLHEPEPVCLCDRRQTCMHVADLDYIKVLRAAGWGGGAVYKADL